TRCGRRGRRHVGGCPGRREAEEPRLHAGVGLDLQRGVVLPRDTETSRLAAKRTSRVSMPASVSIFSVASSCHEIRSRPGSRMIAGAAYALHCSPVAWSFAGSQVSPTFFASAFTGMLA